MSGREEEKRREERATLLSTWLVPQEKERPSTYPAHISFHLTHILPLPQTNSDNQDISLLGCKNLKESYYYFACVKIGIYFFFLKLKRLFRTQGLFFTE